MGSPFAAATSGGGASAVGTTVGATVGSIVPVVGTVIGGAAGGIIGGLVGGGGGAPKTWNGGRGSVGSHRTIMTALLRGKRWHDADAEELWWISTGGTPPEKHVAGTLEAKHGPQTNFDPIQVTLDNGQRIVVGTGNDSGREDPRRKGGAVPVPNYSAGPTGPTTPKPSVPGDAGIFPEGA